MDVVLVDVILDEIKKDVLPDEGLFYIYIIYIYTCLENALTIYRELYPTQTIKLGSDHTRTLEIKQHTVSNNVVCIVVSVPRLVLLLTSFSALLSVC